jgi:hypothetical protein
LKIKNKKNKDKNKNKKEVNERKKICKKNKIKK